MKTDGEEGKDRMEDKVVEVSCGFLEEELQVGKYMLCLLEGKYIRR